MTDYYNVEETSFEYFNKHPEKIDDYIKEIFNNYAQDGDTSTLLSALRVIARVKGLTAIAEETGMTRQGLQKALSPNGNPRLDNVNAIMRALGYHLMPSPVS